MNKDDTASITSDIHLMDILSMKAISFYLPKNDMGRNDVEVIVEYFTEKNTGKLIFLSWANVGKSAVRGHIYSGLIDGITNTNDDAEKQIVQYIIRNEDFKARIRAYVKKAGEQKKT
ncbi:hypothetical protein LJC56_10315 [Christensenellaceae bacterium OttesenSCG-928-K19]|nr:hypothetical protein [Christensenellaceae bacterium OttesenSCG-928-K19]